MEFVWYIIAIQVLLTVIAIVIIGYLIFRRIKLRKKEEFEKREN